MGNSEINGGRFLNARYSKIRGNLLEAKLRRLPSQIQKKENNGDFKSL